MCRWSKLSKNLRIKEFKFKCPSCVCVCYMTFVKSESLILWGCHGDTCGVVIFYKHAQQSISYRLLGCILSSSFGTSSTGRSHGRTGALLLGFPALSSVTNFALSSPTNRPPTNSTLGFGSLLGTAPALGWMLSKFSSPVITMAACFGGAGAAGRGAALGLSRPCGAEVNQQKQTANVKLNKRVY